MIERVSVKVYTNLPPVMDRAATAAPRGTAETVRRVRMANVDMLVGGSKGFRW